jgi:hypothetical protein
VAHVTRQTNRLINRENAEASLYGDDQDDESRPAKQMSSGYVGKILNNDLNLETEKATVGTRPMVLKWDTKRIGALIVRYGLEETVADLVHRAQEIEDQEAAELAENGPKSGQQQEIKL